MKSTFLTLSALFLMGLFLFPSTGHSQISVSNSLSLYGWMDQYSMNTEHNFVGDEACVPTSSVNALTYLQNLDPTLFGTSLTGGTNYSDWHALDNQLISLYGTTTNGTYDDPFVYGLQNYIQQTQGFSQVSFSSMFPKDDWYAPYSEPAYNVDGKPTIDFISSQLSAQSALLLGINYYGGGGHELLANGITWDTNTLTGTLYFIDPLDPSLSYSGSTVLGTAKQSSGTILQRTNGTIELSYTQYEGQLPYDSTNYATNVTAYLYGGLAINPVPEPSSLALLLLCGAAAFLFVRTRRSA